MGIPLLKFHHHFFGDHSRRFGTGRYNLPGITLPKFNMEPKNDVVEDEFPFQKDDFQVPC